MKNITFKDAIYKFRRHLLVEKSYSGLTVKEYVNDLKLLYEYLQDNYNYPEKFPVKKINRHEIVEFLGDIIIEKDNSPVTRNRKLFSLRSFFKFLQLNSYIENNPTENIESSKTETRAEPIYMKMNQARKYLRTIKKSDSRHKNRDLAIIKVFLYAGLRVSELVNLDLENIDFDDEAIKFFGKGNKERYVPLHQDVVQAILDYLPERKKINKKDNDAEKALFISGHGNRISVRTVQHTVKKYAKKAGIRNADKITPHKLRHTFATTLYQETKDLNVLKDLLGHSDISSTQIYTHTDPEQKRDAIDKYPDI